MGVGDIILPASAHHGLVQALVELSAESSVETVSVSLNIPKTAFKQPQRLGVSAASLGRTSPLPSASLPGLHFQGLYDDLSRQANQNTNSAEQEMLRKPILQVNQHTFTGLQLLELAQELVNEANKHGKFRTLWENLFQRDPLPKYDRLAMVTLIYQASNATARYDQVSEQIREAMSKLEEFGYTDHLGNKDVDGREVRLWVLKPKAIELLANIKMGVEALASKTAGSLDQDLNTQPLRQTAMTIRWFSQTLATGLTGLALAEILDKFTQRQTWFKRKPYQKPVPLDQFLKNFPGNAERVREALLEMESLGLVVKTYTTKEPLIALSSQAKNMMRQLQGVDAIKVTSKTFMEVISQEVEERKRNIQTMAQDMDRLLEKIQGLEKSVSVQTKDVESDRMKATSLASQLQSTSSPTAYPKLHEQVKDSLFKLRYAEVKLRAEEHYLAKMKAGFERMKAVFKRWEGTQIEQMQRLHEMAAELELRASIEQVGDRLRHNAEMAPQQLNALFTTLIQLDREGVLSVPSASGGGTTDERAGGSALQSEVDRVLASTEGDELIAQFLEDMSRQASAELQINPANTQSGKQP